MDTAQLGAWFQANKTEALLVGGAAVAGLALYQRKKNTAAAAAGISAGATIPGTIPAAAVVSGSSVPTYDSSAFDAYNALQDELTTLVQQNEAHGQTGAGGSGVSAAVSPSIASTLFNPTYNGQLLRNGGGGFAELQSDGSLLQLTPAQIAEEYKRAGSGLSLQQISAPNFGKIPLTEQNILGRQSTFSPTAGTSGA